LLTWEAVCGLGLVSPRALPPPSEVAEALGRLLSEAAFLKAAAITGTRAATSLLLACSVGLPLGLFLGRVSAAYRAFLFPIDFLRAIPPIALLPAFVGALGISETANVAVAAFGCTAIVTASCAAAVFEAAGSVRATTLWPLAGPTIRATLARALTQVALPQTFAGIRAATGIALLLGTAVDMTLASSGGLGSRLFSYHVRGQTAAMFGVLAVLGCIGYLANAGLIRLERLAASGTVCDSTQRG
jgi:ABC-type nitrate/sulfonate/bicarbonate transport system permease component